MGDGNHRQGLRHQQGGVVPEGLVLPPVRPDGTQVAVPDEQFLGNDRALALPQELPVLGDQALAGKDQVLAALPGPGRGVGIDAGQRGGLMLHQIPAVGGFSNGFVGGGQIHKDLRPGKGQQRGRGHRGPQVLADFHAEDSAFADGKQSLWINAHGDRLPARDLQGHGVPVQLRSGGKPALLVELIVVGDIGLGHDPPESSSGDNGGTVEHPTAKAQGKSHHHRQGGGILRSIQQHPQSLQGRLIQRVLKKQVLAAVARQAQLREYQ